jgi:hypothetical protein
MITIRKAHKEDIPTLAAFQLRLAEETENVILDMKIVKAGLKTLLNRNERRPLHGV